MASVVRKATEFTTDAIQLNAIWLLDLEANYVMSMVEFERERGFLLILVFLYTVGLHFSSCGHILALTLHHVIEQNRSDDLSASLRRNVLC